jgi:broad specificity phosphatase PhoE
MRCETWGVPLVTLELDLVRHIQSEGNLVQGVVGQPMDSPPTTLGYLQATLLNTRLHNERTQYDVVLTSPALRALETTRVGFFGCCTKQSIVRESLVEIERGLWNGRLIAETFAPDLRRRLRTDPQFSYTFRPPGGESPRDVEERMVQTMTDDILAHSDIHRAAVISHGVAIRAYLRHCLNLDPSWIYRMTIENASVTRLVYDGRWSVRCINDTGHLHS